MIKKLSTPRAQFVLAIGFILLSGLLYDLDRHGLMVATAIIGALFAASSAASFAIQCEATEDDDL